MKNEAAWLTAMGRTLLRIADGRRENHDLYTALRGLAFDCAALGLVVEDDDRARVELERDRNFTAELPTQPQGRLPT